MLRYSGIFTVLLSAAIIFSCGEVKIEEVTSENYSVVLGEFKTFDDAEIFKSKFDLTLWRDLNIIEHDENRFLLSYGTYKNSFKAGEKAFQLFQNGLISNYKISFNNNFVNDSFVNVPFVAKYQGRPSVFNYNLVDKNSKLFWSRWGRKVLSVNHSGDRNSVFILTALRYGKQGGFPFLKDTRLYFFNHSKNQIDEILELGDAMQVYSYWENKDTFKVNITKTDSIKSEMIIQNIYSFTKDGINTNIKKREFLLTRDGFPKPPVFSPRLFSTKGSFQLRIIYEESGNSLYLRDNIKNVEVLLAEFEGKIKNVKWTEDEQYVFVILSGNKSTGGENLIVISTDEKNIKKSFTGSVYKDLLVHGNLLFFDEQFEGSTQITIYNFANNIVYDKIREQGGCGINDLFF